MISTLRRTSRRFSQNAPVPCMHSAYYDLTDYLQLPSMMLQELPPWLNLCMLLRLGGVLPGLSTGHASTVSSVEHAEWGTSFVRPQKLQSWLVTLKMACWLRCFMLSPRSTTNFSSFSRPTTWVASTTSRLYLAE